MIKLYKYFIEHNGDCWQSVFPATEQTKSQLHVSSDDAFYYMHMERGIPAEDIRIVPILRLSGNAWK